jgi:type II secretory ATPase GspE/PulE/Tfp pilus assembly ATPase PilB-like protein
MRTLREDGIRKVLAGRTTADEIIRVTTGDAN